MSAKPVLERLDEAAQSILARAGRRPAVGLVLGSGLGAFAERLTDQTRIPYADIPHFPAPSGVVGHAGELVLGRVGDASVAVMSGRIHFYEGRTMAEVVFPARLLARLGARAVVLTNAAGGVRRTFKPGDLMLITDHINFFGTNPLVGPNDERLGHRFPDMSAVYDRALRRIIKSSAAKLRVPLREGVYIGLHGPSYETPAEIRAVRTLGADAVGMSTVPEAIALRHASVRVAGISTITNMAAGILPQPLEHEEVLKTTQRVGERFVRLLTAAVPRIASEVST
ncbi:MAG TPA: purine-nucleoside phosphorylase [Thermoanaerobaculia bacterium]